MTAEIALMNRNGVALAADSAVTIGAEARKIYTSAEKLFQLSECCPIGVMVYGSAAFLNLPWDTIIKSYRRMHGSTPRKGVADFASHFQTFLTSSPQLFPQQAQDASARNIFGFHFLCVRERIKKAMDKAAEERDGLADPDIPDILHDVVEKTRESVSKKSPLPSFDGKSKAALRRRLRPVATDLIPEIFGQLPFSSRTRKELVDSAFEVLFRECFNLTLSGLVFAGFGTEEYMPTLLHVHVEEMVGNCLRAIQKERQTIGVDTDSVVMPFAQQDMVQSFMEGIQRELFEYMAGTTRQFFEGVLRAVFGCVTSLDDALGRQVESAVNPVVADQLGKLFQNWTDYRKQHWQPVIECVSASPKDELAAMAEALVSLTSFRRRVTNVPETVGGPIDVAVITKGDGFVWIKRKHYFSPELNPRIMAQYQGDS